MKAGRRADFDEVSPQGLWTCRFSAMAPDGGGASSGGGYTFCSCAQTDDPLRGSAAGPRACRGLLMGLSYRTASSEARRSFQDLLESAGLGGGGGGQSQYQNCKNQSPYQILPRSIQSWYEAGTLWVYCY